MSERHKILIKSLLLSFFKQEYGNMPTWLNLIYQHQPCVSVEAEDIIHGSLLVISQRRNAVARVKRIQTLFISQNYVSPLWHGTKSKWKSLICCIDSCSSVPPRRNIWRLPVADTEICHSRRMPHGASCCVFTFQPRMKVDYDKRAGIRGEVAPLFFSFVWQSSAHPVFLEVPYKTFFFLSFNIYQRLRTYGFAEIFKKIFEIFFF